MPTIVDCPQGNLGEWRFNLFGVPVMVKLWFWLACGLTAMSQQTTSGIVIWFAACLVAVLVHEMGHVLALRSLHLESDIVLYGIGGLTIPERPVRGLSNRVGVALAGPVAGFFVAALVMVAAALLGWRVIFTWKTLIPMVIVGPASDHITEGNFMVLLAVNIFLWINFYWSLANLLPIYPLDGGQVARALLERNDPYGGRRKAWILSAAVAIGVGLACVLDRQAYLIIGFAVLAVASFQGLEGGV